VSEPAHGVVSVSHIRAQRAAPPSGAFRHAWSRAQSEFAVQRSPCRPPPIALHKNRRRAVPELLPSPKKVQFVAAGQPALVNAVHVSLQKRKKPPSGAGICERKQTPAPHGASVTHGCRQIPTPVDVSHASGDSQRPFTQSSPSLPRVGAWQLPCGSNLQAFEQVKFCDCPAGQPSALRVVAPGAHSPLPVHSPKFTHSQRSLHLLDCDPQFPHAV
jgi:hypothetical protein